MVHRATYEELKQRVKELEGELAERKRLEKGLREIEKGFKALAEHAPDIIARFDKQLRYLYMSPSVEAITGIPSNHFFGRTNEDLGMPKELCRLWNKTFRKVFRTGEMESVEFDLRTKDGTKSFQLLAVPEYSENGLVESAMSIARDITRRKRMEETLKLERMKLDNILNSMQDGVYIINQQLQLEYTNPVIRREFGSHRGKKCYQYLAGANEQCPWCKLPEVLRGKTFHWEWTSPRNGKIYDMIDTPLTNPDGGISKLKIMRDITERKRVEDALRESEERYRDLYENAPNAYFSISAADASVLRCNFAAQRLLGYDGEAITGMKVFDLYADTPHGLSKAKKVFERFNAGESIRDFELQMKRKDGQPIWVSLSVEPVRDRDAKIAESRSMVINISERKQAEEALRKARDELERRVEKRTAELSRSNTFLRDEIAAHKRAKEELLHLKAAIEHAVEGVMITDTDGIVLYLNPAFESITGYARTEIIGEDADIFLAGEHDGEFHRPIYDTIRSGEPWSGHLARLRKDQTPYDVELTVSPVRDSSGVIVNYVAVERDVTHEVKLEEEFRQRQKLEALGTLAGGIAHDFNNILMPITLNTELALRSTGEPDKASEYLQYVLEAAQRGRELVRQIITFSRRREQKREPIGIAPVIKEALKLIKTSLPATIEMRENINEDPSEVVLADPTQIHQVLMNLCANAAHAMREGVGVLEVNLVSVEVDQNAASSHADLKPGPYLRLTVSDTGEGMDREIMERIFEPFFTTKERSEGTGMGLAVVHGIVKNHGGAITSYSELGKGSTFNVFFPRIKGGIARETVYPMDVPTGKERVLLIDDEELVLRSERSMLESLGYKVIATADSDEALKLFRAQPNDFDLVITDQTMPTITGSELSRELLRIRSNIPIILCTGFSEAVDEVKARAEGIGEFVMKPFTTREMAEIIRRVLDA